jgi:hypothetical protein
MNHFDWIRLTAIASRCTLILRWNFIRSVTSGTHSLHANSKSALQLVQLRTLISTEEGRSDAVPARTTGAPDAMDKVFRHFGQIVVNDVGNVLHVNAPRGQVGCDQDAIASLLKSGEGRGALGL